MVKHIDSEKNQSKKLQQFTKGDISQNSKTAKMVLGQYYRVEFQTGPYKTSHFKYLENITAVSYTHLTLPTNREV